MSGRGRRATFPDTQNTIADDCSADITWTSDPLCFQVRVDDGDIVTIDLTSWSHPKFTAAIVPSLQKHIRRMGPGPVGRTVKNKIYVLRRFWRFLDATGTGVDSFDEITVALLDRYEKWLEQSIPSATTLRIVMNGLITVLRVAAEENLDQLPRDMVHRLSYISQIGPSRTRPRDAYSGAIATALRIASRKQIADAVKRIVTDDSLPSRRPDIEACPDLHQYYDAVVAEIVQEGSTTLHKRVFKAFRWRRRREGLPSMSMEEFHRNFHLACVDIVGFIILLSLETGMELECLKGLKVDCLRNPSRGYVEIEYFKRRSHGKEWKRLRVRDGGSSTPGGMIRQAVKLTARARLHLGTDQLWAYWNKFGLTTSLIKNISAVVPLFVARHSLVGDNGHPLHLQLSRLRKTQKAERYLRTEGQLDDFAIGHTVAVAAQHYADIPALRHVHEQTIADAFQNAMDEALRPYIVTPEMEQAIRTTPEVAELPVATSDIPALLDGDQDVWLANCASFYTSPFGTSGEPCPSPFWGCLECENAVITARKLPALIAFDMFIVEQRAGMNADTWANKFARAHRRITEQILPAFPLAVVDEARATATEAGLALLYLPPEASAS